MIKAVITGVTGMVGEGVMHECLLAPEVGEVLVVGRKPCGFAHPKLKEVVVSDFFDLSAVEAQLKGFDACFFCLGVSAIGLSEAQYQKVAHDLTLNFAKTLSRLNPGMTFCYISGKATDSTEKGSAMWARVKGKTENDLAKLPFKRAYAFRPGYLHPTPGLKNTLGYYKFITWLYPLGRAVLPGWFSTLSELGRAMIRAAVQGPEKRIFEVKDIVGEGT